MKWQLFLKCWLIYRNIAVFLLEITCAIWKPHKRLDISLSQLPRVKQGSKDLNSCTWHSLSSRKKNDTEHWTQSDPVDQTNDVYKWKKNGFTYFYFLQMHAYFHIFAYEISSIFVLPSYKCFIDKVHIFWEGYKRACSTWLKLV